MKNKAINKDFSFKSMDRFMHKIRRNTLGILFAAFMFTFLHTAFHNSFDHKHDSQCAVYVLEQFCFGLDVVAFDPLHTLFLPFLFITFLGNFYSLKLQTTFSIRAPPFYSY